MAKYLLKHAFGDFVWDTSGFTAPKPKKGSLKSVPEELTSEALAAFKDPKYFEKFRTLHLAKTKKNIKSSFTDDLHIVQVLNELDELQRVFNTLVKRTREWFAPHNPEFEHEATNHTKFLENLARQRTSEMGAQFDNEDLRAINGLADHAKQIQKLMATHEKYLDKKMKELLPNVTELTGASIGAKLLAQAGSLKGLATLPASTIQLLGAEKALFRHLKKGSKPPKYGLLHEHLLVAKVKKELKGKAASALADKVAMAARVDFFKGNKSTGKEYKKELEERFGKW